MPELSKMIGLSLYELKKDELVDTDDESERLDLWEVTYTWKMNISAETEEDAIAIGRNERTRYYGNNKNEQYTAKRADFIATQNE
jgi:hypothetical protein